VYGSQARIRNNTVLGFRYGILGAYGSEGTIDDNLVRRGTGVGIDIYFNAPSAAGFVPIFRVLDNRVRGFGYAGIALYDAPNNLIEGNDFTLNPGTDCYDDAEPTDSVWVDNLGNDQNQSGLCESPL